MRKIFVASAISVALAAAPVMAADMPPPATQNYYKAPPLPAPSWTGCYISGGGGGGVFTTNQHFETFPGLVALTAAQDNGGSGWMELAGGGCDYQFQLPLSQFSWNVVVGAFGDYDWMNFRGTIGVNPVTGDMQENAAWAGGLRLGVLAAPNVLVYSNGGYTGTHLNSVNFTALGSFLPAQNLNGWFVGGGVETSLSFILPGLYLRTEYRYSKYQTTDTQLITFAGVPTALGFNTNLASQSVFTELVYRFSWPGAAVWH